jgi:uncharacterized membrane protein YvlD (DUF360 family)
VSQRGCCAKTHAEQSDRFVTGMRVNGFGGAIVAAIAIAIVNWLVALLLAQLGIGV